MLQQIKQANEETQDEQWTELPFGNENTSDQDSNSEGELFVEDSSIARKIVNMIIKVMKYLVYSLIQIITNRLNQEIIIDGQAEMNETIGPNYGISKVFIINLSSYSDGIIYNRDVMEQVARRYPRALIIPGSLAIPINQSQDKILDKPRNNERRVIIIDNENVALTKTSVLKIKSGLYTLYKSFPIVMTCANLFQINALSAHNIGESKDKVLMSVFLGEMMSIDDQKSIEIKGLKLTTLELDKKCMNHIIIDRSMALGTGLSAEANKNNIMIDLTDTNSNIHQLISEWERTIANREHFSVPYYCEKEEGDVDKQWLETISLNGWKGLQYFVTGKIPLRNLKVGYLKYSSRRIDGLIETINKTTNETVIF